jgi:transcriptional regulator GlxA family with amidase domain
MPTPEEMPRVRPAAAFLPCLLALALACAPATAPVTAPGTPAPVVSQDQPLPDEIPTDRPLRAGFLVLDGVYNSELVAPMDVLHHTVFHTEPGIEVFTVSPDGQAIRSFEGLTIVPDHSFEDHPPIDVLVVPSAEHNMDSDLEDERLIAWVRENGRTARWVMSLCDGSFVLAQAGLLDGRAATTFPADQPPFAERFPEVDLQVNVSFVHSGRVLTSIGGAKSYDVAMYLVDLLYGDEVAAGVGRGMNLPWPPEPEDSPRYATDRPFLPDGR